VQTLFRFTRGSIFCCKISILFPCLFFCHLSFTFIIFLFLVQVVKKGDMDKAIKDKKHKKYDANFKIEFLFKPQGPALTNASDPRRPFVPRKCELK